MSAIEIRKVETKRDLRTFVDFHYDLYKGDKYDVPTLFFDDMNTLNLKKNAAGEFCEGEYYLAYKDGKLAGRVAAIINHRANERWQKRDVRFGWIDFIDDREVSEALLKAVEDYGRAKGMTAMVGPLGFTDMDPEGMLTDGFDQLGTMATIYNYPYYPQHIESLPGFSVDNKYVEYKLYVPEKVPDKYAKIAEMIQKRYHLRVKKIKRNEIYGENGYGKKIFDLINLTYKDLYGFSQLTEKQINQYIKMYLGFIPLDFVTVIEDTSADNKLVGFGITMPSLAHALQRCRRGRLLPFGWWHLLRAIKFRKTNIVDLLLIGVDPDYRAKGANALLFSDFIPRFINYKMEWAETQVEMETNEKVQSQWGIFEGSVHKRRKCYRKAL